MIHYSVGAVIERDGPILLMDRANPPYGWACPAGHVDEGETPEQALQREVTEETGLKMIKAVLQIEEFVDWNECRQGVKGHFWYVYKVEAEGEFQSSSEAKQIAWQPIAKLGELELEPVWRLWFGKLKWL